MPDASMHRNETTTAERGFTLIELLIALGLLASVVWLSYGMIWNIDQGWSLLQGQLDTQQNPRVATDLLMNDLQQSVDYVTPSGMTVEKVTLLTCPVAFPTSTSTVLIENAADVPANAVVTLTALATLITRTITAVASVTTTCAAPVGGSMGQTITSTGTQLTLNTTITSATAPFGLPYGTLLSPLPVAYTTSGTQAIRITSTLADNVAGLSVSQPATTLSAQANQNAGSITVSSAAPFAVGDLVFIDAGNSNAEIRAISSISSTTVTLDQNLFVTHTSGAPVRRKLAATNITDQITQPQLGGNQLQTVTLTSEGAPRNPPLK